MLTKDQIKYFDNLSPGTIVEMQKAKDPEAFRNAAFDYIDLHGHSIGFVQDYQAIKKYDPIPAIKKNN